MAVLEIMAPKHFLGSASVEPLPNTTHIHLAHMSLLTLLNRSPAFECFPLLEMDYHTYMHLLVGQGQAAGGAVGFRAIWAF